MSRSVSLSEVFDNRSFTPYQVWVCSLCFLLVFLDGFDLTVIGVALPKIAEHLNSKPAALGLALSAGQLGPMLGAITLGMFADRWGRKLTLILSAVIFGVFTFMTAYITTVEQLALIFTGQTKNWKEVGGPDAPITVYSRENSSGTYEFFKEHVLKGRDFAASAQTMPGTAAVLQAVAKDKGGIGYGGAAYGSGAKHIAVKKDDASPAVEPSEETVLLGTYPIWR